MPAEAAISFNGIASKFFKAATKLTDNGRGKKREREDGLVYSQEKEEEEKAYGEHPTKAEYGAA